MIIVKLSKRYDRQRERH